jgi:hypothetical protein
VNQYKTEKEAKRTYSQVLSSIRNGGIPVNFDLILMDFMIITETAHEERA